MCSEPAFDIWPQAGAHTHRRFRLQMDSAKAAFLMQSSNRFSHPAKVVSFPGSKPLNGNVTKRQDH
jgi:hypothetical protein